MATPWDRAAAGYLEEWVPRFVPYHLDLVRELTLRPGQRVLVTSAGPGQEVLAVARAVGDEGLVRATDASGEMVRICAEKVHEAKFATRIECAVADATDARGGPWDAIVCAFGLWQLKDRGAALRAWREALAENGKIGVVTWGPPDGQQPFERLGEALHKLEPAFHVPSPHVEAERDAMAAMFHGAGLEMVRHTVVRHTLSFPSNEAFIRAMCEACTWRKVCEELGEARVERVASRFYDEMGGPDEPLSFEPPATIAIAGHPGADIDLEVRHSMRVPPSPTKPPPG
jgi:ubiquinone/menaquinone biosynthesis C-methylase UbiE